MSLGLTSEVVLVAAISAQVISQIGLGDAPAFHTPIFDLLTYKELPLCATYSRPPAHDFSRALSPFSFCYSSAQSAIDIA
jgi:hypothetical protein